MKTPTKVWLLMISSAVISFLIFFLLYLLSGRIDDKGYNLNTLSSISEQVITTAKESAQLNYAEIKSILDNTHQAHPNIRFEWISSDGTTIYDTAGRNTHYDFSQLAERTVGMPHNLWGNNKEIILTYALAENNTTYYLLTSLSSEAMKVGQFYYFVRSYGFLFIFLIPLIIAFIIPYLFSFVFIFSMNKRLNKLNFAMKELNLKSELVILEDKQNDEIGHVISHYNAMAKRIQNQTEQIKQFDERRKLLFSNLSHDLRTPLTMILGYAETIRTGMYKDEKELQFSAQVLLQRSRYMNKLLDQLLSLSKHDEENYQLDVEEHNVSELVRKIAADYVMFLEGQDFSVEINIPDDDVFALIDSSLIERSVHNLIDNAVRYGAEGKYLEISLYQEANQLFIEVADKGPGIPLEEQQYIFDRFYRGNKSRKGEGIGIGLTIVKEIVSIHGGAIHLSSEHNKTSFKIQLPIHDHILQSSKE